MPTRFLENLDLTAKITDDGDGTRRIQQVMLLVLAVS